MNNQQAMLWLTDNSQTARARGVLLQYLAESKSIELSGSTGTHALWAPETDKARADAHLAGFLSRYPQPITICYVDPEATRGMSLWHKPKGRCSPHPCFLELDCDERTLRCAYHPGPDVHAVPARVWDGRQIRWAIPCIDDWSVNDLLTTVAESAARVCDGYLLQWSDDGSRRVGRLDKRARTERARISAIIDSSHYAETIDMVKVLPASEYYAGQSEEQLRAELGITAETTPSQLESIVRAQSAAALQQGVHLVEGLLEHVTALREATHG